MPLFYFHIRCNGGLIADDEGCEHVNLAAARLEAVRGARSLMCGEVEAGHLHMDQSIEIHGNDGAHLENVTFDAALRISRDALASAIPANDALP